MAVSLFLHFSRIYKHQNLQFYSCLYSEGFWEVCSYMISQVFIALYPSLQVCGCFLKTSFFLQEHVMWSLTHLCLNGEANWQYWQLYLSFLLTSATAVWLLSWERRPCMDMNMRLHMLHGCPGTTRSFSGSSAPTIVSVSTGTVSSISNGSASIATTSSTSPLVIPSTGAATGISATSCCRRKWLTLRQICKTFCIVTLFSFSHLTDAFIQDDLQMRTIEAITINKSQVTFIYIALLTIQIVTKHCTISK